LVDEVTVDEVDQAGAKSVPAKIVTAGVTPESTADAPL
jgi:hypothetical protein